MDSNGLDIKPGNFLKLFIGKTVAKIYKVDFNNDQENDSYLPWLAFITFQDFNNFLEIEGDFDGDHIRLSFSDLSELTLKIQENNFPNEPDLWQVFEVNEKETLGKLLGQKIKKLEYGFDKPKFEINGELISGEKDVFTFIKFYFNQTCVSLKEGGVGLFISDDPNMKLNFKDTFNTFELP